MNAPHKIDEKVLIATAHLQAALTVVPRIIGPKDAWGPWMWDGLKAEQVCTVFCVEDKSRLMSLHSQGGIAKASMTSPHPKLLGSLKVMLARHYRSGMTVDTHSFNEVPASDQSVTGPEYVDIGWAPWAQGIKFLVATFAKIWWGGDFRLWHPLPLPFTSN